MNGYQLTFFTQQNRQHNHVPLGEWLVQAVMRNWVLAVLH